jgi:hypothetical protein
VKATDAMLILIRAKRSGNNMEAFRHHYMENRQLFTKVRLGLEADQAANQQFQVVCEGMKDKVCYGNQAPWTSS